VSRRVRLVLLSFVMLFTELALIRWTGSNVLYLSYFSNFVLLGSFLGIGVGFLRARAPRDLFPFAPLALAALVAFIRFFPVKVGVTGTSLIFFGGLERSGPPRELVLGVIFLAVAAAMAFVAEGVARVFVTFEPLEAYRLDLVGSLLGIAGFSLLSFLRVPPLGWGVVVAGTLLALAVPRPRAVHVLPLLALLALLGAESFEAGASWSPYYKVEVDESVRLGDEPLIRVNGIPHQVHQSVASTPPGAAVYDDVAPPALGDVLVIGAGGGNDVALALAHGARHVDAVEIDPRLADLGRSRHPDRPYADPRVDLHIDDGRAYLERTDHRYDLILFALPDSLTLVSGQSSLRLESYLFTREALETARDHLRDGGVFAMYNYYRHDWLADRLAGTLRDVYGDPPCEQSFGAGENRFAVFAASDEPGSLTCARRWSPTSASVPAPATDDHPFPYLRGRTLPGFYLGAIGVILLVSVLLVRAAAGPLRAMLPYRDLFFMGAAFLLLETKSVVQFALLFGTTWFVNALVFAGVLLSVLVAVAVSRRITFRRVAWLYAALLAALAVAALVPPSALLRLDLVPRFLAATSLAFFPIFVANLVFTQRFKDVEGSGVAFGANLLGAMVGGLLEYLALVAGYRALLLVVAACYGLAFLTGRHALVATGARAAGAAP
jgi:SAM-dependent methyltransferase